MRRLSGLSGALSLLVICSLLLVACGGGSGDTPATTGKGVTLVLDVGGVNDQGFNQLANIGYEQARKKYNFARSVIETKSESDYVNNLTLAAQNSDLVIGVGFLMATAVDQVAKANPSKSFALIDSCATDAKGNCETLANVAPITFKEEQAGCLVGAIAGQMELDGKSKLPKLLGSSTIGAVGGIKSPPVDSYIAGYKYCAQKVNPKVQVVINYSQSFSDTGACKDAATSQINQHKADIIFQVAGGCGVGALQAADEKGVYGIGVDKDQNAVNKSVITSAIKRVDQAVSGTIATFQDGKFSNSIPTFDLKSDGVGYISPTSDVPADAKAAADDLASQIKAGTLSVPNTVP
jgi:basic membrane protein A